ncbi:MAG: hypothetical protein M1821_003971 [Bathelium mastoideum]|nr:MAG: hypothetical protein M1821_003971 [Bathelium mastoideum]
MDATTPAPPSSGTLPLPPHSTIDQTGCRAGDACPYLHQVIKSQEQGQSAGPTPLHKSQPSEAPTSGSARPSSSQRQLNTVAVLPGDVTPGTQGRQYNADPVSRDRVVQRPVPQRQIESPREFQIGQIRRRFAPSEQSDGDALALTFKMTPSDPDFPFDIAALECKLSVPSTYPDSGPPRLRVLNREMGRGYQINVENGFDNLFLSNPKATLLGLMNRLDQQLERLLSMEKAETVKLISNTRVAGPRTAVTQQLAQSTQPDASIASIPSEPQYTSEQKQQAQLKRETDVRQLEARLGRFPLFAKHSDGISFTVPVEPRKRSDLPVPLQAIKQVNLIVPVLYNLQPCRIELEGVSKGAGANVEEAFGQKARDNRDATILSLINNLTQNMHIMATTVPEDNSTENSNILQSGLSQNQPLPDESPTLPLKVGDNQDDRSHIKIIPRPPEWTTAGEDSDSSSSIFTSDSDYESDGEEDGSGDEDTTADAPKTTERGIMMSFPFLELHGVELLELVLLSITVKCERCKSSMDIKNLKNNANGDPSGMRSESCKKCAIPLQTGWRQDLMHSNSVRAGYLDLEGCTVVDMLPR